MKVGRIVRASLWSAIHFSTQASVSCAGPRTSECTPLNSAASANWNLGGHTRQEQVSLSSVTHLGCARLSAGMIFILRKFLVSTTISAIASGHAQCNVAHARATAAHHNPFVGLIDRQEQYNLMCS